MLRREGPLVGAAEQEQCFGEVDRPGVDGVEALDELAVVAVRVAAGDVEQRLRDRQRGAQLVGGVGREPLLFGDLRLESREHGVEAVGELAELVVRGPPAGSGGRAIRSRPVRVASVMRLSGASIRPARSQPPSETERQQEHEHDGRPRSEGAQEVGAVGDEPGSDDRAVGHVPQQEHPHDGEQQGAGEHEESGVAEGELEADAHPGLPIHGRLPHGRCRCGTRRRPRWR